MQRGQTIEIAPLVAASAEQHLAFCGERCLDCGEVLHVQAVETVSASLYGVLGACAAGHPFSILLIAS